MDEPAIEVENLVKVYREGSSLPVRALDGLSLRVSKGEIFGLLGRNGAGKTSLLRILTTMIQPSSGRVSVLGSDIQRQALDVRKKICVVLQENAVELYLSVWDNLSTYGRFHSIPRADLEQRADHVIGQFGLREYVNQKVIDLSGGLRRRVQVAKVFLVDKPLVFLDEATTGMDPINKRATLDAIREQSRIGRTIFLTTHMLQEAEELCDSIAIIDHGRCVAYGNLRAIKALATNTFDIEVTFDAVTDPLLDELRQLPLVKLTRKKNTIAMSMKGEELAALELVSRVAKHHKVIHIEVSTSTLEDAFLELLEKRSGAGRATREGPHR
jgi:ABC-2 type transport system ATP-binding protein